MTRLPYNSELFEVYAHGKRDIEVSKDTKDPIVLTKIKNLKKKESFGIRILYDKDKFKHPTIKPLNLVERHIKHTTQENDIILDCFCGSGTTCVACKNTNRRYIGIELNSKWHKVAVDRLNNIQADGQQTLFTM